MSTDTKATEKRKHGRILLICPQAFLINRGTPLSILIILQALTELGYSVDMVTTHLGENRHIDQVKIHRIPRIPFLNNMPAGPSMAKFIIMPFIFMLSLSLLIRRKYGFIVSLEDGALYGKAFRRLFGIKHIAKIESLPTARYPPGTFPNKLLGIYENLIFSSADVLLPMLATEEEYIRSKIKEGNQKIEVIEAMPAFTKEVVSAQRVEELRRQFGLTEDDVVILWIGNLANYQGASLLHDTVSIMSSAGQENPIDKQCKFLVTGKEDETRKLFKSEHHENLILFEPEISDMPDLVALGDVCLSFRNGDIGFPSKVLVFMRAGKPTVAVNTRSHGCHLTHGENSYLIGYDKNQAAEAIRALASDKAERQRIGQSAKRYFDREFSWEKYRQGWKTAISYVES
jgi:glycosyltransferase involved in cell wall biosynthesis